LRSPLAQETLSVETSQLCPPQVREAINAARAALEQANERAPADLAYAAEAAEIMGASPKHELAHALLARPPARTGSPHAR